MSKIHIPAFLLVLVALLPACALLEKHLNEPSVSFKQTSYQHISLNEGILKSRIQLTNPNNFGLPIHGITYHLTLNDKQFAQSRMSLDRKIPAISMMAPSHTSAMTGILAWRGHKATDTC